MSEPVDTSMVQLCSKDILLKPDSLDVSCKPRFFLDLFSGAKAPVSTACKKHVVDMFEPIDIIHGHDLLDDDKFFELMALAESGLIGAGVAAPFCCKHSRVTLRRPGPRPVKDPRVSGWSPFEVRGSTTIGPRIISDSRPFALHFVSDQPWWWPHHLGKSWV